MNMNRLPARLLIIALGLTAVFTFLPSQAEAPTVVLKHPYNFTLVRKAQSFSLSIDTATVSKFSAKDGDVLVGGIFFIQLTKPFDTKDGKKVYSIINAIAASCKKDTVTLLNSKAYDSNANLAEEDLLVKSYNIGSGDTTVMSLMHKYLCDGAVPKSDPNDITWT
jgi:hypothetical protein